MKPRNANLATFWHLPHLRLIQRSLCLISFSSASICGLTFERGIFQNTRCLKIWNRSCCFFKWVIVLPSNYPFPLTIFMLSFGTSTVMLIVFRYFCFCWIIFIQELDGHNSFLSMFSTITVHKCIHSDDTRVIVQISQVTFLLLSRTKVEITLFQLYLFFMCVRPETGWISYQTGDVDANMRKYESRPPKKTVWTILIVGAAPLTDDKDSEGLESQKYWYTTWHKFLLLICFSSSWNGFWQLRVMLAEYEGQRGVRSVLFA